MTDEQLVKWLRNEHRKYVAGTIVTTTRYLQAADRIEALTAEVAAYGRSLELKQALIEALQADKAKLRKTLMGAPIIGAREGQVAFKFRQDEWLKTKYRAALEKQP
jgi:hypothetical protein